MLRGRVRDPEKAISGLGQVAEAVLIASPSLRSAVPVTSSTAYCLCELSISMALLAILLSVRSIL